MFNAAAVAGPPFPDEPAAPDPAIVLMVPSGAILRTRLFRESAMKMLFPCAETPRGALRAAADAEEARTASRKPRPISSGAPSQRHPTSWPPISGPGMRSG